MRTWVDKRGYQPTEPLAGLPPGVSAVDVLTPPPLPPSKPDYMDRSPGFDGVALYLMIALLVANVVMLVVMLAFSL